MRLRKRYSHIEEDRKTLMIVRLKKTGRDRHNEEGRQRVLVNQRKTERQRESVKTKSDRQTEEYRQRVIILS